MKRQYLQPTTATNTYDVAYNCMQSPSGNAGTGGTENPGEQGHDLGGAPGRLYR